MTAIAIAQLAMQLLPTVEMGAQELWQFITSVRSSAQQSGAWTPEQESQFQAALIATQKDPAWTKNT